jgi:hypothetical protein
MITELIREHDGDCYTIEIPEQDEIKCDCEKIILWDLAKECDVCSRMYCPSCGTEDYKSTEWFICNNCLDDPELIIDFLVNEINFILGELK